MGFIKKLFFFIVTVFLLFSLTKNIFDFQKNSQFYKDFKSRYLSEKKKNLQLKTQFLKKSDPNEVEKTIRNKLNLFRPGETAIIIPEISPTPPPVTPTPVPVYLQWWRMFVKKD